MNRNALTAVSVSLQLEIRSRNEEAINSTRNSIYSLKVFFTSYLIEVDTSTLFICCRIDFVRGVATSGNTSAVIGYKSV